MNLYEAERQAKLLMTAHGITQQGWRFEWDNAVRRFGQTRYNDRVISLSRKLTVQRSVDSVRNTMLHEIAHVKAGYKNGHNATWRSIAISIGCDGKRCSDDPIEIEYKYIAKCPNGHLGKRYVRKPRASSRPRSCGKCSNVYNPKYALKVVAL
ncbi:SprT-like protease [Streptomyces phage Faust]|uniref:SprT-like protease n=1 Tax=Streptomyces phage Faust TaxID=2767565 RepID=A0A7G9UZ55_9CAUD|nr:SprT-like protease [Streptomyces phage Faust]QNN99310.1 SprT-like protease [Streptomyces phage Faust]